MYFQTALLICCMLAAGESARVRRFVWCDDLKACTAAYDALGDPTDPANLATLKTGNAFNEYCNSVSSMESCVGRTKGSCWNEDEKLEATVAVQLSNYICAEGNRADFLALAALENTCLEDPQVDAQLETDIEGCATDFEVSVSNIAFEIQLGMKPLTAICPLADDMGTCIDNKVKAVCEPEVSGWFSGMIDYSISINTNQFGCPAKTTTKRLVQRSLAMLRRR